MKLGRLGAATSLLVLGACQTQANDGPLGEEKLEVASAAPGALGALAAGTDAAPPPPTLARPPRRTWQIPGDEVEEEPAEPEDPFDGGVDPDAAPEMGSPDLKVPL